MISAHRTILAACLATACACGGSPQSPAEPAPSPTPAAVEAPAPPPETAPVGKLPTHVTPTAYDLALVIDPSATTFEGQVSIRATLAEARRTIWLHGRELSVKRAAVTLADGRTIAAMYEQIDEHGLARLTLPEQLQPQEIVIAIAYTAPFDTTLDGLYKIEAEGRPYVFAQFESISARRCFPSFDEPRFKTTFDLTVTARAEHAVVATTHAIEETPVTSGMKRVRFARTEVLPTYLVTFAVGELDIVDAGAIAPNAVRDRPVPLRGVAVKGRVRSLRTLWRTRVRSWQRSRPISVSRIHSTSSTSSPSRTSPRARWRMLERSPSATCSCSSTRRKRPSACVGRTPK